MTARRDMGRGMTGATYAALPMGPQLNNYRDLVDEILRADPADAEPLTTERRGCYRRRCQSLPNKQGSV
jgi:hypothetical protein